MRTVQVMSLSVTALFVATCFSAQARANSVVSPQNFTLTALNESMDTLQSIEIATSNSDGTTDWASLLDDALTSESILGAYSDTIAGQSPSAVANATTSAVETRSVSTHTNTRAAVPSALFGTSGTLTSNSGGFSPDLVGGGSSPEPNSMVLTAFGVLGVAGLCLRRRTAA